MMTRAGIVIPAKNEEQYIEKCIVSLLPFQQIHAPVIVVNAKSKDRTDSIVKKFAVDSVQSLQPERGFAVAQGIQHLQKHYPECEYAIIAHADMQFSSQSAIRFTQMIDRYPDVIWGAFGHRIQAAEYRFRIIEFGNMIRARFFRFPYGDQVQFFRLDALSEVGFPKQSCLEDVELCYRFKRKMRYVYLNEPVWIPNRHWKNGIIKTTIKNWLTVYRYRKNRNNPDFNYNPTT